jgi:hypothetical protein
MAAAAVRVSAGRNSRGPTDGLAITGASAYNADSRPENSVSATGSSRVRTNYLVEELLAKKQAALDKLLRERQVHHRRGHATSSGSVILDGGFTVAGVESVGGNYSAGVSPRHGGSIASMSKMSLITKDKSSGIISPSRYSVAKMTVNTGNNTTMIYDDQNMSLFTPKSNIYVKKNAPSPFIYTLDNTVPVVFPHYERKKVARESHTKAFKDKIAEVMLQSQAYGKIERPYLFSLLKQSGGKASAYLSGKSSTEIIEEAYRKAELARQLEDEEEQPVGSPGRSRKPSSPHSQKRMSDSGDAEEAAMPLHQIKIEPAEDIFKYVPKKKIGGSTTKALASIKGKKTVPPLIKAPPPPPVKLEVMTDDALEALLSAVDRERLNYHLNRQVAIARSNNFK